jgi:hypothetical protein
MTAKSSSQRLPARRSQFPASAAAREKFVDDLANHVESNFVSIVQLTAIAADLKQ